MKKFGPDKLQVLCIKNPWSFASAIINGGRNSLQKWSHFRLLRVRYLDLDLGSGDAAYSHESLIDLYVHTKFH